MKVSCCSDRFYLQGEERQMSFRIIGGEIRDCCVVGSSKGLLLEDEYWATPHQLMHILENNEKTLEDLFQVIRNR